MDYAMTQSNLGAAYVTLAEVENKAENSKIAIRACEEALKVHNLEEFPMDYAEAQSTFGSAYKTLATVEGRSENCKKAEHAFQEALNVWVKLNSSQNKKLIEDKLSELKSICN
jgi:tetratricopeptide (TPR) repeat protein